MKVICINDNALPEGAEIVEGYYNQLPEHIKKDGIHWGFSDSVVQDSMCECFKLVQKRQLTIPRVNGWLLINYQNNKKRN